jgi:hypothetical protein
MVIQPAPFPALGIDTITNLDTVHATALKDAGFKFAIRYLGSVTAAELAILLDAGLSFMPVTYSRPGGWTPTAEMGTQDGQNDIQQLKALGILTGCTVWIDLEGVSLATPANIVSEWINNRAAVMKAAGFDVGVYVGVNDVLSGPQLYAIPNVNRYWKSASDVPTPTCGFCLLQLFPTTTVAGISVDVNVVQQDWEGRLPMVVSA